MMCERQTIMLCSLNLHCAVMSITLWWNWKGEKKRMIDFSILWDHFLAGFDFFSMQSIWRWKGEEFICQPLSCLSQRFTPWGINCLIYVGAEEVCPKRQVLRQNLEVGCVRCGVWAQKKMLLDCGSWVTSLYKTPWYALSSVMSNSLWPHELLHTRLSCPSPTPGAYSNSCLLTWWCHPTIRSSVVPFSSHLQSFPASGSSPRSQFFASGGQSIGPSASASVLPMSIQAWFPLGWTGWIFLQSKDSQESSPTPQFKSISSLALSFLYGPTLISISIHDYWKNHSLD